MRQVWINIESGGYLHTVPIPDLHPHGTMDRRNPLQYLLTASCACNPEVQVMENGIFLAQPHVTHHSFQDIEGINKAMANPTTL